jgi:hypothetical protein
MIIAISFIVSVALNSFAFAAASNYCPVAAVTQDKSNWCWAACAEMTGNFRLDYLYPSFHGVHNPTWTQWDVVYNEYGSYVNLTGSLGQTRNGIRFVGYYQFPVATHYYAESF